MPPLGPKKTGVGVSLLSPLSGAGFFFVIVTTAFLGLMRFIVWVFSKGEVGLSAAGVIIFALLGGAYFARYLVASVESSAEGYDLAPPPPDPREAETLFGALMGLVILLFFCLLPLSVGSMLGLAVPPISYVFLGFAVFYFPMGLLGVTVRGDLTGCFPPRVLAGIVCSFHRYLAAILLCAGAGFLLYLTWAGGLVRLPWPFLVAMDAGASWLLISMTHRVGVIHREEPLLRSLIPIPEPTVINSESTIPSRPMTEIERILMEREKSDSQTLNL